MRAELAKSYESERLMVLDRYARLPSTATQVRRSLRAVATCRWFEAVRDRVQTTSAYATGKRVQPRAYRCIDGGFQHENLWAKYARGEHHPSRTTVAVVDTELPGTALTINDPCLKILDTSRPLSGRAGGLSAALDPLVQGPVFRALDSDGRIRSAATLRRSLELLEDRAIGLHSVLAAVLLLRCALVQPRHDWVMMSARALHSIVLMSCMQLPLMTYRAPVLAFLVRYIFPLARTSELSFDIRLLEMCELVNLLHRYTLILEDFNVIDVQESSSSERRRMLHGELGFDLACGFAPRICANSEATCKARAEAALNEEAKEWGFSVIRRLGFEPTIPLDVIRRMNEICGEMKSRQAQAH